MRHPEIERSNRISHDIRTPLTVIKEYAGILREQLLGDLNNEQHNLVEVIEDRADEIHLMVENLLLLEPGINRLEQVDRRPFSLTDQIRRLQAGFEARARRAGVELEFVLPQPEALSDNGASDGEAFGDEAFGDEALIELLTRNLLSLALRQRSHGDRVRFHLSTEGGMFQLSTTAALDSDASSKGGSVESLGISGEAADRIAKSQWGDLRIRSTGLGDNDVIQLDACVPRWDPTAVVLGFADSLTARQPFEVIALQLEDIDFRPQFEGLLRYSIESSGVVLPIPATDTWLVLAPVPATAGPGKRPGKRPDNADSESAEEGAFLEAVSQFAGNVGLQLDYRSARMVASTETAVDSLMQQCGCLMAQLTSPQTIG